MSSELVSLRVLVLRTAGSNADLLRQGTALASLPLEIQDVESRGRAVGILEGGGVDIVLLDNVGEAEQTVISKAAREASKDTLVIVLADDPKTVPAGTGCHAAARRPRSVEEARLLLDGCVRAKLPSRVLVIDDSSTMRSIVRKILSASRFKLKVDDVDSGLAGLAHVHSGNFPIVILDYNMPGLDGLATLAELKRVNPAITVVLMTSAPEAAVAQRAIAAGASAFLKKPFYPADIDAALYRRCGLTPLGNAG